MSIYASVGEQARVDLWSGATLAGKLTDNRVGWFVLAGQRFEWDRDYGPSGGWWSPEVGGALSRPVRFDPIYECLS